MLNTHTQFFGTLEKWSSSRIAHKRCLNLFLFYYCYEIVKCGDSINIFHTYTHIVVNMIGGMIIHCDHLFFLWISLRMFLEFGDIRMDALGHIDLVDLMVFYHLLDRIVRHNLKKKINQIWIHCSMLFISYLLPFSKTRITFDLSEYVCLPIEIFSKRFAYNDSQHFGNGFVKHGSRSQQSDRWQSYCKPFRRRQSHKWCWLPRSSRLLHFKILIGIFCKFSN